MVLDRQNAFDDTVNYNVLDIDDTVKSPNPPLYAPEAYLIDSKRNDRTLEAEQVYIYCVTIARYASKHHIITLVGMRSLFLSPFFLRASEYPFVARPGSELSRGRENASRNCGYK